jgi:hypothetical protein
MIRKLNLDIAKAAAVAGEALERLRADEPEVVEAFSRRAGSETAWRVRADLIEGDRVAVSIVAAPDVAIGLAIVPRERVERDRPALAN